MADGTPDPRTLHVAQDADDVKWVAQQWIARGYSTAMASHKQMQDGERGVSRGRQTARNTKKKSGGGFG
jgi:hypothetical protein